MSKPLRVPLDALTDQAGQPFDQVSRRFIAMRFGQCGEAGNVHERERRLKPVLLSALLPQLHLP